MKREKKQVVIFTSHFPYYPGEHFIESEINHWSNIESANVTICPYRANGTPRNIPNDITILPTKNLSKFDRLRYAFAVILSSIFWIEVGWLKSRNKLNLKSVTLALKSCMQVMAVRAMLTKVVDKLGVIDIAYFYWQSDPSYAACLLKREGKIKQVVARAHGADLYEERRDNDYMPLKRQFTSDFDCIYAIGNEGKGYLANQYGFNSSVLSVSRLGVSIPSEVNPNNESNVIQIVSVSYCTPVKRIDKIIEALRLVALKNANLNIHWTHLGDGPLREKLELTAEKIFAAQTNIKFTFAGMLENAQVLDFYRNNPVDVFINSSDSEGVPVSIMEAMAFGIPAIAPAVGGIPELIDSYCGILMSSNPTPEEIKKSVEALLGKSTSELRQAARLKVMEKYNAEKNYKKFVQSVLKQGEFNTND